MTITESRDFPPEIIRLLEKMTCLEDALATSRQPNYFQPNLAKKQQSQLHRDLKGLKSFGLIYNA